MASLLLLPRLLAALCATLELAGTSPEIAFHEPTDHSQINAKIKADSQSLIVQTLTSTGVTPSDKIIIAGDGTVTCTGELTASNLKVAGQNVTVLDLILAASSQAATTQAQTDRITALEAAGPVDVGSQGIGHGGYALGIWQSSLPTQARATPDNRCNTNAEVLAGQNNNGATSNGAWNSTGGFYNGCGYAYGYLHLLTDVPCGSTAGAGGLFSFGFTGVILTQGPFDCRLSGYSIGSLTINHPRAACSYGGAFITPLSYCNSAQHKVTLRLQLGADMSGSDSTHWHASQISVAAYSRSNTKRILRAMHSGLASEDFADGVDRRSQVTG